MANFLGSLAAAGGTNNPNFQAFMDQIRRMMQQNQGQGQQSQGMGQTGQAFQGAQRALQRAPEGFGPPRQMPMIDPNTGQPGATPGIGFDPNERFAPRGRPLAPGEFATGLMPGGFSGGRSFGGPMGNLGNIAAQPFRPGGVLNRGIQRQPGTARPLPNVQPHNNFDPRRLMF